MPENGQKLMEMDGMMEIAETGWTLLESLKIGGNGLIWLKIGGNDCKCWKLLKMGEMA